MNTTHMVLAIVLSIAAILSANINVINALPNDLKNSYTVQEAIDRFHGVVTEDTESFIVQPNLNNNTVYMYDFDGYGFELHNVYEDNESGLNVEVIAQ